MSTVSVEKETILDLKKFFDAIIEQADMRADRKTATVIQPFLPLDQMRRLKEKIDNLATNCVELREPIGTCGDAHPDIHKLINADPDAVMPHQRDRFLVDVKQCQRCGQDHDQLSFMALFNPADDFTHFSNCPTNGQPIALKIVEKDDCARSLPVDCEAEQRRKNNVAFPPTDQSLYIGRDHRPQRWVQDGPDDKRDFRRE